MNGMIGEQRVLRTISYVKITCYNENIVNISFSILGIL